MGWDFKENAFLQLNKFRTVLTAKNEYRFRKTELCSTQIVDGKRFSQNRSLSHADHKAAPFLTPNFQRFLNSIPVNMDDINPRRKISQIDNGSPIVRNN